MSNRKFDLEDRLLEYSAIYTSIRTAEEKSGD